MLFLSLALADPPYSETPCEHRHAIPRWDAEDVPLDVDVQIYVTGGRCDGIDSYSVLQDGQIVAEGALEVSRGEPIAVPFDAWTPGPWRVELLGAEQPIGLSFVVIDQIEVPPAAPTVDSATARKMALGRTSIVLSLDLAETPGIEMFAIESASGVRHETLPAEAYTFYFDERDEGETLCVDVTARGRSATWSEPTRVCREVAPARRDDSFVPPSTTSTRGCATATPKGARWLRR